MSVAIYKITSPSNRIYIGQSWNIEHRFTVYKNSGAGQQTALRSSFLKYGRKNHLYEILLSLPEDITQEDLDNLEIFYIAQYKECQFRLMNIALGGSKGKHSEETKKKLSNILKGRPLSKEGKERLRNVWIGRKHKESTKLLISNKHKGKKLSEAHKEAVRKARSEPRKYTESFINLIKEDFSNKLITNSQLSTKYNIGTKEISYIRCKYLPDTRKRLKKCQ